jgi:hypothetical protein
MTIFILILVFIWISLGLMFYHSTIEDISIINKIFYYSPLNIVTFFVILINNFMSLNYRKIKRKRRNRRNKFLFEKYKAIDPYGEETWDD